MYTFVVQTAIDGVVYALGQTDTLKGTGVWSGLELKREKPKEDDDEPKDPQAKKQPEKQKKNYHPNI